MHSQGSEQLARLWTESQPVVGAYIHSLVPNFHQAEDVLQQVAVMLVREFDKYDASRPFLPWALGIARNLAMASRRTAARSVECCLSDDLVGRIQVAFQEQGDSWAGVRQALRMCMKKQPQKVVEVLKLRYAYDLKYGDVAKRMGITDGAARVMLHRAREVLRRCIQQHAGGTTKW
ncbi:sigma-70 family RNA polymerase sigma factor [Lacipirellula sp.]|uniref:sigma-70 family RNA polymerase sigma factor n=1 Tax=Lacipirellula sp. TaxID=2691419 RepID=UPI003D0EBF3A